MQDEGKITALSVIKANTSLQFVRVVAFHVRHVSALQLGVGKGKRSEDDTADCSNCGCVIQKYI